MSKSNEERDIYYIPPNFLASGRLFGSRNQDFFLCQQFCDCPWAFSFVRKKKNALYDFGCHRINNKCLLVVWQTVISIRNRAAATFSIFHPGIEHSLDFIARVFGIPFVHNIQKRSKIIV